MPCASFSMLYGPGGTGKASAKTQVSLTRFLQSEVKIIHIIVQNKTYYSARSRWTKQHFCPNLPLLLRGTRIPQDVFLSIDSVY